MGSFINCLVYRVNHGLSFWKGRSVCPKCKHQLAWKDNLPLLSFLFLRGKCRYCHSPISWQYPLVELAAGILSLIFFPNWFYVFIAYVLLAIFVSDLRYMIVPDEVLLPAIVVAFLITPRNLVPGLATAGFFYLLNLITHKKGMGLGDMKLAGLMGLVLGWPALAIALYLSFLTGALVGVILVLGKKKKFKSQIAFGPFLCASTFITLIWGEKIWTVVKMVFP
jgi:leader peptidase (prepilin peptidase)/N-methyltransferase